jgi:hypothetical protein
MGRPLNAALTTAGLLLPLGTGLALPEVAALAPTADPLMTFAALAAVGVVGGMLVRRRVAVSLVPALLLLGLLVRLVATQTLAHYLGLSVAHLAGGEVAQVVLEAIVVLAVPPGLGAALGLPLGVWLEEHATRKQHT